MTIAQHGRDVLAERAATPLILSASRATDIPAFHIAWLMNRLRAGHCARINPFNGMRHRISFAHSRFIVFWSKNPAPLLPHLTEVEELGLRWGLHYTLNDYEREKLEPGLPPLTRRVDTLLRLAERWGRDRVIWRFDPLILGGGLSVEELTERIGRLALSLRDAVEKLVFSFIDIESYAKARSRLRRQFPELRGATSEEKMGLAKNIAALCAGFRRPLIAAACAEQHDLRAVGVQRNSCMDPAWLLRLWREQPFGDADAVERELRALMGRRDPGQRDACGCAPSRDIGAYGTCPHLCAYCYANPSESAVRGRMRRLDPGRDEL